HGKLISFATTTSPNLPAVPLHFEIDNRPEFLPGSFADVFLKTDSLESSITIPVTALLEEQGNFSVYVQTAGESFQKREVQTGARDGKRVQILTGIKQGERVVTKGAYQIK
ncbi:efflux transporter periplasmic adaptor subunit, partial [Flavihumibacter sediminis]|nr:efflux transporter periplasmic adaptor subunit [Flavihumibacter sediminis]